MPAKSGRGEVSGSPKVEGAGEGDAADTVQGRANPTNLGLVNGKVGSNRTVQALLNQDLGRVLCVGGGGDGSRYEAVSFGIADDVGLRGVAEIGDGASIAGESHGCERTNLDWIPFPRATAAGEARIIADCMASGCWTATVVGNELSVLGGIFGG